MTYGRGEWYEEHDDRDRDWDHKRSKPRVSDLSEMLRGRKKTGSENINVGRVTVDAREKIRAKAGGVAPATNNGIKSRLGNIVTGAGGGGERKRKLEPAQAQDERRISSLGAKKVAPPSRLDIRQSIVKAVRDNDRKDGRETSLSLKHETFIEKKSKTGEAMAWDSKLIRPRMGMVADMRDSRVSAKNRLHQSGENSRTEEVIKRVVPNQTTKFAAEERSGLFRNVVLTEVVEEEEEPTVANYDDEEMDEDGGGFFEDRIVKTRDQYTEHKIKQQKRTMTSQQKSSVYDLETDAGTDLPELGSTRFVIKVRNDSPPPTQSSPKVDRPVLEAKRTLESKKTKQRREAMLELKEIEERERERETQKRVESRQRREEEDIRSKRRELELERKKIRELEAKRLEEERKLEELRLKKEQFTLEQELKKREDMLKVEEEERKILGIFIIFLVKQVRPGCHAMTSTDAVCYSLTVIELVFSSVYIMLFQSYRDRRS